MNALSAVEILERLVSFPTVSQDPNLPLIDWVRNFLAENGVDSYLVPNPIGSKANLFASIGPAEEGGLVLSGHTDVVPTVGQVWSSDPFTLTARGSRLYARGACDMKGFIAAVLSRVPAWKSSKLIRPVHLMFSYDEEVGCLGAPSMIAMAREALPAPSVVIVGEPTSMRVANAHKGICVLRTRVTGIEAHSSLAHKGVSAVMLAADLIAYLGECSRNLAAGSGQGMRAGTVRDIARYGFEPPFTTLSVNRVEGGTAVNILAASCEFNWDIRTLPGESASEILDQLSSFANARLAEFVKQGKHCSVDTDVRADVPPLAPDAGPAEPLARAAAQYGSEAVAVSFATEGGQFQQAGWSTVVCGPGSIEQAHKPDEFIERSELEACEVFLNRSVAQHCQ